MSCREELLDLAGMMPSPTHDNVLSIEAIEVGSPLAHRPRQTMVAGLPDGLWLFKTRGQTTVLIGCEAAVRIGLRAMYPVSGEKTPGMRHEQIEQDID
jgi:hypothetical protein